MGIAGHNWGRWLTESEEKTPIQDIVDRANLEGNRGNRTILVKISLPGNRLCLSLPVKTEIGSLKGHIGERIRKEWPFLRNFLTFLEGARICVLPTRGDPPRLPIRRLADCGISERGEIHIELEASDADREIHLVHPILRDVVVRTNGLSTLSQLENGSVEQILGGTLN